jgi:hypothetical protein
MATYEQTLPRLTTHYSGPVAAYDEKHANSPHGEMPYDRHSKLPLKTTRLGLNDSRYMVMCTQSHQARKRYTIGAALFSWLILAGYLVLPNTFTSLQSSNTLSGSKGGQLLQSTVRNVKLLPFAGVLCLIGVAGISRLWYKWRRNYVWLITYIFMYVKLEILPTGLLTSTKAFFFACTYRIAEHVNQCLCHARWTLLYNR